MNPAADSPKSPPAPTLKPDLKMTREDAKRAIQEAADSREFLNPLVDVSSKGEAQNLSCGDQISIEIKVGDGQIQALSAEVRGCLVTKAAWTLLAQEIRGLDAGRALETLESFQNRMSLPTKASSISESIRPAPLAPFARPSPRKDCALLPAVALTQALHAWVEANPSSL